MPSPESAFQAELFGEVMQRLNAYPDLDLQTRRDIFDCLHALAFEPTDVTYEEVAQAGNTHALWIKPLGGSKDHVILYTHGGGFLANNSHSHRKAVGHLAKWAGVPVLSIDYRLTPEHQFPAQIDDAVEAYRWLVKQGYKPQNIATAGDSAGGNLAITTVLKLRDLGEPLPGAIVGFSPWVDMEMNGPTLKTNAATDKMCVPELIGGMIAAYLGPEGNRQNPLTNPLYADFKGMPPMYIVVGTYETLQDNGERVAEKARNDGVDVTLEHGQEMQHVYVFMAGRAKEADDTMERVGKWLKQKLSV